MNIYLILSNAVPVGEIPTYGNDLMGVKHEICQLRKKNFVKNE